jgi:hypothetical protein
LACCSFQSSCSWSASSSTSAPWAPADVCGRRRRPPAVTRGRLAVALGGHAWLTCPSSSRSTVVAHALSATLRAPPSSSPSRRDSRGSRGLRRWRRCGSVGSCWAEASAARGGAGVRPRPRARRRRSEQALSVQMLREDHATGRTLMRCPAGCPRCRTWTWRGTC